MKRYRNNTNLNETTRSEFELMGEFGVNPDFLERQLRDGFAIGVFKYEGGKAEVKTTPVLYTKDDKIAGGYLPLTNSIKHCIYGFLEDGTFVRLNTFSSSNHRLHISGLSAIKYISYETDFSRLPFNKEQEPEELWITINSLSEIASYIIPQDLENTEALRKQDVKICELTDFDIFLKLLYFKNNSQMSSSIKTNIALKIKPHKPYSEKTILNYINKFEKFISIINDSRMDITSIRFMKDKKCIKLRLPYSEVMKENASKDFSSFVYIPGLAFKFYTNELGNVFKAVNKDDINFNNLINNYIYNINRELNINSSLLDYVNSIEFYMAGKKFKNGKNIKSLNKKISFFIESLPEKLYHLFFEEAKSKENPTESMFINSVVDTRDYLTHGEKTKSEFLITDFQKQVDYVEFLRNIIRVKILYKYNIPEDIIYQEYSYKWGNRYFCSLIKRYL